MIHNIHDFGIERNKSQKKDLLTSQIIMGGFLILCTVCLLINFGLGVLFSFTGVFWGFVADDFYKRSITPTAEQLTKLQKKNLYKP